MMFDRVRTHLAGLGLEIRHRHIVRRSPDRRQLLTSLFVVLGATIVFAPAIWSVQRWSKAAVRDPANAWGARWLGEHLSAHPYLRGAALLLGVLLSSGLVMLMVVYAAKRLATRLVGHGRSPVSRSSEKNRGR